ncbi:MAG: hypothetical protein LBB73_04710, partial [Dysgonamonadaceae bacterium]|nr:hypothetical protein [Dysgonamonadaceae bacterium]
MKRKLFTLLLAIGVLMAFQTNAQSRYRILADTSGLAKKFVNDVSRNDSFPKQKKELYRWLSVNEDGKFVVRSVKNEGDTAKFRDELYRDASGVFNLSFSTLDSLNYRFSSGERHLSLDVTG